MNGAHEAPSLRKRGGVSDHSYKYQRLRERIRQAVATGELSGKLPGERELARRFEVNAKTLSKALTDLAAEGLLSRSIGRGTFVKGAEQQSVVQTSWLLICSAEQADSPLAESLRRFNPEMKTVSEVSNLRPSFLNQFGAVIDMAASTPDQFLRDLLVRNLPVVVVGREPSTYSTSAVLLDVPYLATRLARDLLLAGHRNLAVVESRDATSATSKSEMYNAVLAAAARYAPDASIKSCNPSEVLDFIDRGTTAVIADSASSARQVQDILTGSSVDVPGAVSLVAVALATDAERCCTGFFLAPDQQAEAIAYLLKQGQFTSGGNVLWLTGKYFDGNTSGIAPATADAAQRPIMTLSA
ncbi:MAG TPA: GntR family transcriptional regulator [Tepidisphaeraceae bacterium]|nr:GntR family transcriptional regulator [Tepidisphaeraceae bacterium]